jgi:hypothetical protein
MESKKHVEGTIYLVQKDLLQDADAKITGARFIGESLKAYGVTHVFLWIPF